MSPISRSELNSSKHVAGVDLSKASPKRSLSFVRSAGKSAIAARNAKRLTGATTNSRVVFGGQRIAKKLTENFRPVLEQDPLGLHSIGKGTLTTVA